ncbi:hypothetical protein V5O48_019289, partial [Marasmius crinis-equi]
MPVDHSRLTTHAIPRDPRFQNAITTTAQAPTANDQLNALEQALSRITEEYGPLTRAPVISEDFSDPTKLKLSDQFIDLFCTTCQRLDQAGLLAPMPNITEAKPPYG